MVDKIRIAARASPLSIAQAMEVIEPLREMGLDVELLKVKSTGDVDKTTPLYIMWEKGIFEKEVDRAVLEGRADAAVHSAKDVLSVLPPQLVLAAVPRRRSPFDALVSDTGSDIWTLPPNAKVGTSSLRRMSMIKAIRRDLDILPIRGNLDTRLRKIGEIDAVVVAEAGLERMDFKGRWSRLPSDLFIPAAGQGALAVHVRKDREDIIRPLRAIDDNCSRLELITEKTIVRLLGAGCKTPLGVLASLEGTTVNAIVASVSPDYSKLVKVEAVGHVADEEDAWEFAGSVTSKFARAGGLEVLDTWRKISS